jgi:dolichyl-phosphate-mannose--protein O-mannosyl transferase
MFIHFNCHPIDSEYVTCGSAIKLSRSEGSNEYFLSSDGHRINSGSGQQLVTASPDKSKQTTLWIVKEQNGAEPCITGTKIPYGTKIRLTHLRTGANLHSHNVRSPLSSQLEVSGFGENGEGDGGDDWIVNPVRGSGTHWKRDEEVVIQHVDTSHYLGCTEQAQFTRQNCGHNCPVMNHLVRFFLFGVLNENAS